MTLTKNSSKKNDFFNQKNYFTRQKRKNFLFFFAHFKQKKNILFEKTKYFSRRKQTFFLYRKKTIFLKNFCFFSEISTHKEKFSNKKTIFVPDKKPRKSFSFHNFTEKNKNPCFEN